MFSFKWPITFQICESRELSRNSAICDQSAAPVYLTLIGPGWWGSLVVFIVSTYLVTNSNSI